MDKYVLARDADIIAKFVSRITKWNYSYQLHKVDPQNPMPRVIGKDAKWPAYEAAGRIERALGITRRTNSVSGLAEIVGAAITAINKY
jgi:hypothetical protein